MGFFRADLPTIGHKTPSRSSVGFADDSGDRSESGIEQAVSPSTHEYIGAQVRHEQRQDRLEAIQQELTQLAGLGGYTIEDGAKRIASMVVATLRRRLLLKYPDR